MSPFEMFDDEALRGSQQVLSFSRMQVWNRPRASPCGPHTFGSGSTEPTGCDPSGLRKAAHLGTVVMMSWQVVNLPLQAERMQVQPSDTHMLRGMYTLPDWATMSFPFVQSETALEHLHKGLETTRSLRKARDIPDV